MLTQYIILLAGAVLLILLIPQCVKIIHEDERLAVLEMGRMTGLIGPGLQFILPGTRTYVSVIQGDPGELLGPKIAHINGFHLPVRLEPVDRVPVLPSLVRVAGFSEQGILVECVEELASDQ
ncbi:MAG: hypothetical protein KC897_10815 [Candidatus Omnitrophica bacterium]|nr:hypothetical protein [Candidatus Omnitrophota bacterium]MCB9721699.1 hypothetical protein [Candidatus Omnitrophota bacterium]